MNIGFIGLGKLGLPCAETHAQHCVSIPCHPQMSNDAVAQVIEALNNY